jgi:hypothetical protein
MRLAKVDQIAGRDCSREEQSLFERKGFPEKDFSFNTERPCEAPLRKGQLNADSSTLVKKGDLKPMRS